MLVHAFESLWIVVIILVQCIEKALVTDGTIVSVRHDTYLFHSVVDRDVDHMACALQDVVVENYRVCLKRRQCRRWFYHIPSHVRPEKENRWHYSDNSYVGFTYQLAFILYRSIVG